MSTINESYINALLSDATYALDDKIYGGEPGSVITAKLENRMTPTLAKYIGDNFTVVTHVESGDVLETGFDATVWRDKAGKTYVSMRGSEGLADFLSDIDLTVSGAARSQIESMVNWWLENTTEAGADAKQIILVGGVFILAPSVEGTGILSDVSSVSVNGHSLGGHLATVFARLFGGQWDIDHTYTYNSAGFTVTSELFFKNIELLLDDGMSLNRFPDRSEQSNYYAENGLNVATQNLFNGQNGQRISLFNEESTGVPNHYMYKLTDSLSLANTLFGLDASLDTLKINALFEKSSNKTESSLKIVLDIFFKIFSSTDMASTPVGDGGDSIASRTQYHVNLDVLKSVLFVDSSVLNLEIKPQYQNLKIITVNSLADAASLDTNEGEAYRYALLNLNTFAVVDSGSGNLYVSHNQNGELNADNFSGQYLTDRAGLLDLITQRNQQDLPDGSAITTVDNEVAFYQDLSSGDEIQTFAFAPADKVNHYVFGSKEDDVIEGHGAADHFYDMGADCHHKLPPKILSQTRRELIHVQEVRM